jgi:hypothetical protein
MQDATWTHFNVPTDLAGPVPFAHTKTKFEVWVKCPRQTSNMHQHQQILKGFQRDSVNSLQPMSGCKYPERQPR